MAFVQQVDLEQVSGQPLGATNPVPTQPVGPVQVQTASGTTLAVIDSDVGATIVRLLNLLIVETRELRRVVCLASQQPFLPPSDGLQLNT